MEGCMAACNHLASRYGVRCADVLTSARMLMSAALVLRYGVRYADVLTSPTWRLNVAVGGSCDTCMQA